MTAYLVLMLPLALFHAAGLVLNTSHVRTHRLQHWKNYVPGWAAAAFASIVLASLPFGPVPSQWSTRLGLPSAECYQMLMLLYVTGLLVCLAIYFFGDAASAGVPRSFIAYVLRMIFGRKSDRETMQLIRASEYAVFGAFGTSVLLPLLAAFGYDSMRATKGRLAGAALGVALFSMVVMWSIRRWAGEPHQHAPERLSRTDG